MIVWNSSRVTTSSTTERRCGGSRALAASHWLRGAQRARGGAAGTRSPARATAPVAPGLLLGGGLLFAGGTGVAGLLLGAGVLQTAILDTTLPVLGDVKLVTSLFFDMGVYLIVVGLALDVLRSLGAELDRQEDEDDPVDLAPGEMVLR